MIKEKAKIENEKKTVSMSAEMQAVLLQDIIEMVEQSIYEELGIQVKLLAIDCSKPATANDIATIMQHVANALCMTMADYRGGRKRHYADLRCMACYIIKLLHPETPIIETACALGVDHSTVIYHINRAKRYLETKESQFVKKYQIVINTLNNGN